MKLFLIIIILSIISIKAEIMHLEPNYELVDLAPGFDDGHVRGFEIINDTIYACGTVDESNILFGGFYNFIKLSPDLGDTWQTLDSTFYTLDNIGSLERYRRMYTLENDIFVFTNDVYVKHTSKHNIKWDKYPLEGIEDMFCNACKLVVRDSLMVVSSSSQYCKSYDNGRTWERYQRNIPDSAKGFSLYHNLIPNDSTEYYTVDYFDSDENQTTKVYLMKYNLNQNKLISLQSTLGRSTGYIYIEENNEIYLAGHDKSSTVFQNHPMIMKTESFGNDWEVVMYDSDFRSFGYAINNMIYKNGIFAFNFGRFLYISDSQKKDFYRIMHPDSLQFGFLDIDSKGNIYCSNIGRTSYYKFYNPYTSVEDKNKIHFTESAVRIFPNPATDEIEITGIENANMQEIEIFNMLGEKVVAQLIHPLTWSHRMNVNQLPTGMYIIKIGDKVTKFIKR